MNMLIFAMLFSRILCLHPLSMIIFQPHLFRITIIQKSTHNTVTYNIRCTLILNFALSTINIIITMYC